MKAQRGYTLIVVMVLLAVLMVLGAGAIQMATSEIDGAGGHRRQVQIAECARAARQVLLGQLQFMQPIPTNFKVEVKDPSGNVVVDVASGHDPRAPKLDTDGDGAWDIADVEFMNPASLGGSRMPTLHPQITNDILPPGGATAAGSRIIARCRDARGRTQEVEFQVMYGVGS